jgi:hypothetical protein
MNNHRRAVLQLVAMGRVTPAQAERLLMALNEGQQTLGALVACIAILLLTQFRLPQLLPGLLHTAQALLPWSPESLHHALSLITQIL